MKYKGYRATIVEIDEENNLLHGEVLGLRDIITFQGSTLEEARIAFQESLNDYLEFCEERNEEPDIN